MAPIKKRSPAVFIAWTIALVTIVAVLATGLRFLRQPRFLLGQRDRISPVSKPADLSDRSFFLVGSRYLLRLGPDQPSLTWAFDRPVQGRLRVAFFISAKRKPVSLLKFVVTAATSSGRKRRLISETLQINTPKAVERRSETEVSLPAGAKIELTAIPETADDWAAIDAGITVPLIETAPAAAKPSHLLIISIDALRSDFLGVYRALAGQSPVQSFSPELDLFSQDAVVFLNARTTQSATWPALSSLHLSAYPFEHGSTRNGQFLDTARNSIATLMRGRGYATVALLANGNSLNIPGFEEKREFLGDAPLIEFARKKISAQASAPFFHWYHLWGVHDSYAPPEWVMKILEKGDPDYRYRLYRTSEMMRGQAPCSPEEIAAVRRLYAGAVYYVDSLLKMLFDDLKGRGLWDDTLIIVTADHGEELYDHHRYFYHNPSLYDSAIKVPLLIKFPRQRGRRVIEENVSLIDIFPTIYDYFAGPPAPGQFSGLSLIKLLKGRGKPYRQRVLFAEAEDSKVVAAIKGRYKLIYNPNGLEAFNRLGLPFPFARKEFYDLRNDPGEITNLAVPEHPASRRLLSAADQFLRLAPQLRAKAGRGKIELTEEQKKEAEEILRSLGYIR